MGAPLVEFQLQILQASQVQTVQVLKYVRACMEREREREKGDRVKRQD